MTTTTTALRPSPVVAERARRAAIVALARVEARRLVLHAAFLLGLVLTLSRFVMGPNEQWAGQAHYMGTVTWTFAFTGMFLAAALVAGRQRFLSDPDLLPATPVTRQDRVLATMLALLGPTVVAAGATILAAVLTIGRGGYRIGDPPYSRSVIPSFAEFAQPLLLVTLAGVIGVGVAQLRRGRLAVLLVGSFATLVAGTAIWMFQMHPFRVLHPFMFPSYEKALPESFAPQGWDAGDAPLLAPGEFYSTWREVHFDTAALSWHLVYVVGLIALGVWWATRAAGRGEPPSGRRWRWLLPVAVSLLVVGGTAQIITAGVHS